MAKKGDNQCPDLTSIRYHCNNCGCWVSFLIKIPINLGDTYYANCPKNHFYKLTMEVSEIREEERSDNNKLSKNGMFNKIKSVGSRITKIC